MKYFFIYIIILLLFIISVSYYNTYKFIEGFDVNNKTYILLGDSILKNDAYVSNGKSIEDLLVDKNQNIYCYAQDNSKIVDIYTQINKISLDFNSPNTLVFLSAGGNDILSHYVDQNQDITNTSVLNPMFAAYKNLIKSIQNRIPKAQIILLDIYYPNNITYKQFHYIIKEWNNMIYEYANSHNVKVLRISSYLTQNEDFSFGIEPSSYGGKKIADLILTTY